MLPRWLRQRPAPLPIRLEPLVEMLLFTWG
jgi:hypothetical protein